MSIIKFVALMAAFMPCSEVCFVSAMADTADSTSAPKFTSSEDGNIFAANVGVIKLDLPSAQAARGGQISITDELGNTIETRQIAPGAKSAIVTLPAKGFYRIKAHVVAADSSDADVETTAAVVGPLIPREVRLKSSFGFMGGPKELVVKSGAGWTRGFEPTNGIGREPDGTMHLWSGQSLVPQTDLNTVNAIMQPPRFTIDNPKRTADNNWTTVYAPTDWVAYRKAVRLFGSSSPWIKCFEECNEPDAGNWKGTDEELVEYHRVIRDELHGLGLGQKLLGPCFWGLGDANLAHIKKLVELGLLNDIDGLSVHEYVSGDGQGPPEGHWIGNIQRIRKYLASIGKPDLPIYLTEYGWTTGNNDAPTQAQELLQAQYSSRAIALVAKEHLAASIYFIVRYESSDPATMAWSTIRHDHTPRPVYAAIATAYHWLTGCEGGQLLHPTPTSYLILFRKESCDIAVAWDTAGSSRIRLPGKIVRMEGLTGHPVESPRDGLVTLSESPIYAEISAVDASELPTRQPVKFLKGSFVVFPPSTEEVRMPAPLQSGAGRLCASLSAVSGEYVGFIRKGNRWVAQPVTLLPQWEISSSALVWPPGAATPAFQVTAREFGSRATLTPILRLSHAADVFGTPISIVKYQSKRVDLPVNDVASGEVLEGTVVLEGRNNGKAETAQRSFSVIPLSCPRLTSNGEAAWVQVPAGTSASWKAFGNGGKPLPTKDCSLTYQTAHDDVGVHVRVNVQDDVLCTAETAQTLWQRDSVQFVFLNPQASTNGAVKTEYGVALIGKSPEAWRFGSTAPGLPSDVAEKRILAVIRRNGLTTSYDIVFPWVTLGVPSGAPPNVFGFDIAVNDSDGKAGDRHGLELTPGIVDCKSGDELAILCLH